MCTGVNVIAKVLAIMRKVVGQTGQFASVIGAKTNMGLVNGATRPNMAAGQAQQTKTLPWPTLTLLLIL